MAKKQFDELEKQENELKQKISDIQTKKAALKKYLVSVGLIEVKKRGRRKKASTSV